MEVKLIDTMGSDLTVVNAARVSFAKESELVSVLHPKDEEANDYDLTFELQDRDKKLIKYLADHNHFTPFTHVMITMREKVPIFVARQRFKHMVGFSYNEISRRYVNDTPEGFIPDFIRSRPEGSIKQGSGGEHSKSSYWMERYVKKLEDDFKLYDEMIADDVTPEQARMILPLATYTEYYATGSLAAWARAFKLRSDPHAQFEIQELAYLWDQTILALPQLKHSWKVLTE